MKRDNTVTTENMPSKYERIFSVGCEISLGKQSDHRPLAQIRVISDDSCESTPSSSETFALATSSGE